MDRLSPILQRFRRNSSRSKSPSVASVEKYEYEALFHEDYIRVCRILPGLKDQPIRCELIEVPIHGCPLSYECLSYTWGAPEQSHSIMCGNGHIAITKTLHNVLLLLRHVDEYRDLWIDQICINQQSVAERGTQVQMMADIYRNADHVFIWLGEASKDSALSFTYAGQLASLVKKVNGKGIDDDLLKEHGLAVSGSKAWSALGAILQRPWFSRAWVVQEVSVAKEATIYCGDSKISWSDFILSISRLSSGASRQFGANLYHNGSPLERAILMETCRNYKGRADPFKIFTMSKNCDATNDSDKLFAFTGLVDLKVKTDYLRHTEEIYTTFAKSYITRALKGFAGTHSSQEGRKTTARVIAGFLCNAGKLSQKYDLPSWVPDWSVRQTTKPFWTTKTYPGLVHTYNAGGEELGECEFDHSLGFHISVMMVDAVARTGSVDLRNTRDWTSKQLQEMCSGWFNEASAIHTSRQTPYINGQSRNEAFIRTLVADIDNDCKHASLSHAQNSCQYFLNYIQGRTVHILFSPLKTEYVKERFALWVASTILGRTFFLTQQGFIGLGPFGMRAGDEVAVMLGSDIPFAVRKRGEGLNGPEYDLLGECYVHGIMFGEVWNLGCPVQRIVLK